MGVKESLRVLAAPGCCPGLLPQAGGPPASTPIPIRATLSRAERGDTAAEPAARGTGQKKGLDSSCLKQAKDREKEALTTSPRRVGTVCPPLMHHPSFVFAQYGETVKHDVCTWAMMKSTEQVPSDEQLQPQGKLGASLPGTI
ncbi:hypothetical protein SRHO_G00245780 [Serrasalmus rhombeus]